MNLFVTSDQIGSETGGGVATFQQLDAFRCLDETDVINPEPTGNPFLTDQNALIEYEKSKKKYKLAHFYSGTYSKLIERLKKDGTKVTYGVDAHNVNLSKEEHEKLGVPFNFPHLTDKKLWSDYIKGYLLANTVISSSTPSAKIMQGYGCKKVEVVPHGCYMPKRTNKTPPKRFIVGYLGAIGPDKGLIYLIKAWAKLAYKDSLLILAGANTPHLIDWVRQNGGGAIQLAGWLDSPADLYEHISLYCQPSVSEGFGIEVLEALSYGLPVICSAGAGAVDCITDQCGSVCPIRDIDKLAELIDSYKNREFNPLLAEQRAQEFTWDKIRRKYLKVWNNVLASI